jgi:hypothetical protein
LFANKILSTIIYLDKLGVFALDKDMHLVACLVEVTEKWEELDLPWVCLELHLGKDPLLCLKVGYCCYSPENKNKQININVSLSSFVCYCLSPLFFSNFDQVEKIIREIIF